jgi:hypothetical protein
VTGLFRKLRGTLLGAVATALALATTTALAGSGVGGVFNLGQANSVDAPTSLSGNPGANPQLRLVNGGTGAALRAESQSGIGVNGTSVSGTGQFGQSQSGIGLQGVHTDAVGTNPGIEGKTNSADPTGAGVIGRNTGGGPGLKAIVNAGAPPLAVNSQIKVANLNADLLDGIDSPSLQKRVTGTCAAGQAIKVVNADGTVNCEAVGLSGAWSLSGNSGTTPGTHFLGTTDNKALVVKTNGAEAMRVLPAGNVGIGVANPSTRLEVAGTVQGKHADTSGTEPGLVGETNSSSMDAVAILGRANATTPARDVVAVRGINKSANTYGMGVWGSVDGSGWGVLGDAGANGIGVVGKVSGAGGGVYGEAGTGYGVSGRHFGTSGTLPGLLGETFSGEYGSAGVRGVASPPADPAISTGVEGINSASVGAGVAGCQGFPADECHPVASAGGYFRGANLAALFWGDVQIVGNLDIIGGCTGCTGAALKIDDPVDPAHRYLQHSAVTSPDMLNVYSGNVTTDGRGFATVTMPRWFQALNRSFRYQLTILGHAPWDTQARVWDEIANNRFTIRTNRARVKVSWQVTGIRRDPYANAHRLKVELRKPAREQGRYLHPALYGKPASLAVGKR